MEIVIENENTQLVEYNINFEQAKAYIIEEMNKYSQLVVSDEFMQMAKKSRAELNAKKKELTERFRAVKKKHNEPIDHLKSKVDELLSLIEEPLSKIDEQIKEYEHKVKLQKQQMILEIFEQLKGDYKIELSTIFNPKWLNTDYSKKKITEEITCFFERLKKDLEVIESFDDEFVIPLKEFYMECFDMSSVMQKKVAFDKAKKEKQEQEERERIEQELLKQQEKEQEQEKEEILPIDADIIDEYFENEEIPEMIADDLSNEKDDLQQNVPDEQEKPQENQSALASCLNNGLEYIEFWVRVTPEQKLALRKCVIENNIKCGKLV